MFDETSISDEKSEKKIKTETTKENLKVFQKRFLTLSLFALIILFAVVLVSGLLFQKQILFYCQWVVDQFGFFPMAVIVYLGDTILSPIPPDLFLLIIANSNLSENWFFYCTVLSLSSTFAGVTSWFLGVLISKHKWMPQGLLRLAQENRKYVSSYGAWAVAIGAMTPFPFSVTCWAAGVAHLSFHKFIIGALMRFPRIFIYYWAIESAVWVPAHLP